MKTVIIVVSCILLTCVLLVGMFFLYNFTFVRPKLHLRIIERVEDGKCMCGSECPEEVSARLKATIRNKWGTLEDAKRRFRLERYAILAGLLTCAGTCVAIIVARTKRRKTVT